MFSIEGLIIAAMFGSLMTILFTGLKDLFREALRDLGMLITIRREDKMRKDTWMNY